MARDLPIRSNGVSVYVSREGSEGPEYLLLRRSEHDSYPGLWQQVTGSIHEGETAWEGALRELREETGLLADRLYSADQFEMFYDIPDDSVMILLVFVAFVAPDTEVRLSEEHSAYEWLPVEAAGEKLSFAQQVSNLRKIHRDFVLRPPTEHLRIPIPDPEPRQ
jgi:dihydroneopterin triphosphate diphosphatase